MIKKFLFVALAMGLFVAHARAAQDLSSYRVSLSTTITSPTRLWTADQSRRGISVANQSSTTGDIALVKGSSTSFSSSLTTGTARMYPGSALSPDGVNEPYNGEGWGVSLATYPISLDIFPTR